MKKGHEIKLIDHLPKGSKIKSIDYLPRINNGRGRMTRQQCLVTFEYENNLTRVILNTTKGTEKIE